MSELRLMLLLAGLVLLLGIYLYSRRLQKKSTARNADRREPSFATFVSDSDAVPTPVPPPRREPIAEPTTVHADEVERVSAVAESAVSAARPVTETVEEVAQVAVAEAASPARETAMPLYEQADLPLPEELRPEPQDLKSTSPTSDKSGEPRREMVIVMRVAAKGTGRFSGRAVVDTLTAESLQFGEFNIFHRMTDGQSLFSVASMVEPGTFDMATIEQFSTPGLTFFLQLPGPDSPVGAFTEMLSTARRIAEMLGGDVLDETGSTLSRQAASHLREQIIEFAHRIR